MKNKFLLSIVIPTKNREKYVINAIEQILLIDDYRIQVVIQDNSDTSQLSEMVSIYKNDPRIKYNYTKGIISFVDNFSMAVELSDGEYICIIGDDDGIVPQIIEVVEWAKINNIDAIKPELSAVYFWPSSESLNNKEDNGNLTVSKITNKVKVVNPYNEVIKLLHNGCQKYLSLDMVKLYHGVVKKECLDKIKKQTGRYFGGLTPDIYSAVSLSLSIKKLVIIDFPLTISGICNKSGSADSATGRHTGSLDEAPHFRGHNSYDWSELVPSFYSVETIWADSAIAAICDLGKKELLKDFNITALKKYCIKKYPEYKNIILKNYNSNAANYNIYKLNKDYYTFIISDFYKRAIKKVTRKKYDSVIVSSVENIVICNNTLQNIIKEKGINIDMVIKSLNDII